MRDPESIAWAEFFIRHTLRCPGLYWPRPNSDAWKAFFGPWLVRFAELRATLQEADAASIKVAADPPYIARHLAAISNAIQSERLAARVAASRDQAEILKAKLWEREAIFRAGRILARLEFDALPPPERKRIWAEATAQVGRLARWSCFVEARAWALAGISDPENRGLSVADALEILRSVGEDAPAITGKASVRPGVAILGARTGNPPSSAREAVLGLSRALQSKA